MVLGNVGGDVFKSYCVEAKVNQQARSDSTADLLDVIRGNDGVRANASVDGASEGFNGDSSSRIKTKKKNSKKRLRFGLPSLGLGGDISVGVDITSEHIAISKMVGPPGRGKIQTMEVLSLGADQIPGTPSFISALSSLLSSVIDKPKKTEIWTLLRTSEVDVSTLRLPKMPLRRLSSAVYWQLQKEKKFDEAEFLLDYRIQGQVKENGIQKLDILTCLAKKEDVLSLTSMFEQAGYPLSGITVVPAAFRSLYENEWVPETGEVTANIHVDTDFTCITIFAEGRVLFSRTIKFGALSLAEELKDNYESGGGEDDLVMPDATSEFVDSPSMSVDHAFHVIQSHLMGEKVDPVIPGSELSWKEVFDKFQHALDRVSRQAERTLDYFAQNYAQRCDTLHLSGEIFVDNSISDYVSSQLGLVAVAFDSIHSGGVSASVLASTTRQNSMRFNECIALALSRTQSTLNLKQTYIERIQETTKTHISNAVSLVAMVLVAIGAGLFLWGSEINKDSSDQLKKLEATLGTDPIIDQSGLQLLAGKSTLRNAQVRKVGDRYRSLAVLNEVTVLMPEGVRLLSFELELGQEPDEDKAGADKPKKATKADEDEPLQSIVLDGIILSTVRSPATLLTRLLANLESSYLLTDVTVDMSEYQTFIPEGEVMHFIVKAGVL